MVKLLAIDWGSKRVGLATGNGIAKMATPLATWPNTTDLVNRIQKYCAEKQITTVVVGLPRGLEGQETAQSAEVRQFVRQLVDALTVEVKLQDETLTTVAVGKHQPDKDAKAAALILEDYLNSL